MVHDPDDIVAIDLSELDDPQLGCTSFDSQHAPYRRTSPESVGFSAAAHPLFKDMAMGSSQGKDPSPDQVKAIQARLQAPPCTTPFAVTTRHYSVGKLQIEGSYITDAFSCNATRTPTVRINRGAVSLTTQVNPPKGTTTCSFAFVSFLSLSLSLTHTHTHTYIHTHRT